MKEGKRGAAFAVWRACCVSVHQLCTAADAALPPSLADRRARTAARASWSRLIDAVLTPTTSDAAQQAQQTQQPNGGSAAAPGAPGSGAAAAATVEPEPSALALQEASLTGWLRRAGSGLLGSRASMAASDASSAADADGTAAAAAGKEGDAAGTGQAASGEGGAGNALARTSLTASASHRLGLSAALDTLVEGEPAGGPPAASLVSPERSLQRVSAAASPASPLLGRLPRGFVPSSPLLASRLDAVRGDVPEGIPLLLFPDTTEGRLAQVSRPAAACGGRQTAGGTLHGLTTCDHPAHRLPCCMLPSPTGLLVLLSVCVRGAGGAAGGAARRHRRGPAQAAGVSGGRTHGSLCAHP